ncbi:hypothetical protein [Deinococcus sp. AJ005]|uniref:hypothetical protein n=1 Tax=Deinococcus sp. AJ005 TaxID=2652443 RepID=UPI00125CBDFE|nr:hypothetical protein [Deinococcus sp. AJ005]QFP78515.1 hypothetical protein DAAJ005_18245 [Deinococcus sp. AJ005]
MKTLLPVCLALGLLSACGNEYKPVELPMTDPNVLSGQWQGQLTQQHSIDVIHSTASRVYVKDQQALEVFDVQTGKVLAKQLLPSLSSQVIWRADGVLLALREPKGNQAEMVQYDAQTLAPLPSWPLPQGNPNAWSLSRDGETALYGLYGEGTGGQQDYDTRTREKRPLAALPSGLAVMALSADATWAVVGMVGQRPEGRPVQVQNRRDGRRFEVPARPAPAGCDRRGGVGVGIESIKTATGEERLLLTSPDGLVQVRSASGQLQREIALWSCEAVNLEPVSGQPDQVVYSVGTVDRQNSYVPFTLSEVGLLDLNSGQKVQQYRVGSTESVQATPSGFLAVTRPTNGTPAAPADENWRFQTWAGGKWNVPTVDSTLKLDLTTTRVSDTEARTAGTATLNGRTLTVSGKITTFDLKLKAQARPFMPYLEATLELSDGQTTVGRLELFNALGIKSVEPPIHDASKIPVYRVRYIQDDGSVITGEVKRP